MDVPTFFRHESDHLPGVLHGSAEHWLAPVAYFDAQEGFGEEMWLSAMPQTMMAMRLAGATVRRCWGRDAGTSGPGREIALHAKGAPNHYECQGPIRFAQIFLPDALLDRAAAALDQPPLSGRLRDDLTFQPDALLHRHGADYIRRAVDTLHRPTPLEMEARALLVVERLAQLHGPARAPAKRASGGLSPSQLRQVCRYLMDRLPEDVPLAELAALVQLSPFHFCRAFKQSTGLPPYRWQLAQRVERACQLLARSDMPVTAVAAAVGYDDPSQFATAFRRCVGITPSQYRKERRT